MLWFFDSKCVECCLAPCNTLLYLKHCYAGLTAVFSGVLHQGIIDEMQPGLQTTRSLLKTTCVPLAVASHLNISVKFGRKYPLCTWIESRESIGTMQLSITYWIFLCTSELKISALSRTTWSYLLEKLKGVSCMDGHEKEIHIPGSCLAHSDSYYVVKSACWNTWIKTWRSVPYWAVHVNSLSSRVGKLLWHEKLWG